MTDTFIPFDDMRPKVRAVLAEMTVPEKLDRIYLVRDLWGKLRISVSDTFEEDTDIQSELNRLAKRLSTALGVRGYPADEGVLFVYDELLKTLDSVVEEIMPRVFLADRLVSGDGWWTVRDRRGAAMPRRITLYSIKGGVGRSTTSAVLAWYLARNGQRVLTVDMDLQSPGLTPLMIESNRRTKFGLVDWFVEDLVGQGDQVIDDMLATPAWAQPFDGDVRVVPAHGENPGEYLAKLGRLYMRTPNESWADRVERVLTILEAEFRPTVVLLESRNGLHDIAAASVTDLKAEDILLFATDSESTWRDYEILFRHWREKKLAKSIRERISVVSSLTPVVGREEYVREFRTHAWDLFRENLYDNIEIDDEWKNEFWFDLMGKEAPHDPMEINWNQALFKGILLKELDEETVNVAYGRFLESFERRGMVPPK